MRERGGIPVSGCRPFYAGIKGQPAMLDMYLIYQMARRPIHAMARQWVCRGLHRVTKGEYCCPECGPR
jgi:hypothetical protein